MVTLKCTATVAAEHSAADCKLLKLSKLSIVKNEGAASSHRSRSSHRAQLLAISKQSVFRQFSLFKFLKKLIAFRFDKFKKTFLKSLQLKLDEHPLIVILVHFRPTNRRDSFRPVDLLSVDLKKPIVLLFRLVDIPHLVLLVGNIAILASRDFLKISIATSNLYFLL